MRDFCCRSGIADVHILVVDATLPDKPFNLKVLLIFYYFDFWSTRIGNFGRNFHYYIVGK